jgi:hypothetical protein
METNNPQNSLIEALKDKNYPLALELTRNNDLKIIFSLLNKYNDSSHRIGYMFSWKATEEDKQKLESCFSQLGENDIPILVKLYSQENITFLEGSKWFDMCLAQTLFNIGGEPDGVYEKMHFFKYFKCWEKLIKLGDIESACSILFWGRKWKELVELEQVSVPFLVSLLYDSYKKNDAEKLILEIGKPAIPCLVEYVKKENSSSDFYQLLLKLGWVPPTIDEKVFVYRILGNYNEIQSLGEQAVPVLVKYWLKNGSDSRILAGILKQFNWIPESEERQIEFYRDTKQLEKLIPFGESAVPILINENRWDLLMEIGEKAIPYLKRELDKIEIKFGMLSSTYDRFINIGNTLMHLGWSPESIDKKLGFYLELKAWQKLKMLGEPALDILLEKERWIELGEIREISISFLVNILLKETISTSWDTFHPQNSKAFKCLNELSWVPINTEEKLAYYLYKPDWEEVVKLGDISISYLIQIFHKNIRFKGQEAGQALLRFGDKAIPFLDDLLNQIAKEGMDHSGFMTTDRERKINESEFKIATLLFSIGSESAILCVLKSLPNLWSENNKLFAAKKIVEVLPNFQSNEIKKSMKNTKKILFDQFANGEGNGKVLEALNADVAAIAKTYIDLLRRLERPTNYYTMLDFFVKNKVYNAVYPLLEIVNIPKFGREQFYKDIIVTVGKIGNVDAIPLLKKLLFTKWNVAGRSGNIEKIVDSKWIESQVQWAINELEKSIQPGSKLTTITGTTTDKNLTAKPDNYQFNLNETVQKNSLGEKQKNKWWKFW